MTSKNHRGEKAGSASTSKPRRKPRSNVIPFPVDYRLLLNESEWLQSDVSSYMEGQYKTLPWKKPKE